MPVSLILCEGGASSPDLRLLGKLLAGLCEVRPSGGKYGMGNKILSRRELLGGSVVYGLLDGDFRNWVVPTGTPQKWEGESGTIHFGWRWERKEIENYLIDPLVVENALGYALPDYSGMLDRAAAKLVPYQAARITLSLKRPRFVQLPNAFGKANGRDKHLIPEQIDPQNCLSEAQSLAREWSAGRNISDEEIESLYTDVLAECSPPDGDRFKHFLSGFAGKDLLWSMNDELQAQGFASPLVFLEKILVGISKSSDDIALWLPEWQALRQAVGSIA